MESNYVVSVYYVSKSMCPVSSKYLSYWIRRMFRGESVDSNLPIHERREIFNNTVHCSYIDIKHETQVIIIGNLPEIVTYHLYSFPAVEEGPAWATAVLEAPVPVD